ncbi:hypothetical protein AC1031_015712 [Aphanomyces cochlioides]|nr:hypothetical protein AC1031_015712 [Aphanomyces cochlioides]
MMSTHRMGHSTVLDAVAEKEIANWVKLCAPTRYDLVKWASNAWNNLSIKTIINGFEKCMLIAHTSNNEDNVEPFEDDSSDGDDVFDSIVELARESGAIRSEEDIFGDVIYEVVV